MSEENNQLLFNKYENPQMFCADAFDIVQQICASSNHLPETGEEYDFYQSFSEVCDALSDFRNRLFTNVNRLLKNYTSSPPLSADNTDVYIERLIEANDELLERISNTLDEASGLKKHTTTVLTSKTTFRNPSVRYTTDLGITKDKQNEIKSSTSEQKSSSFKPQLNFSERIDNTNSPFIPKLLKKPNAINPLPLKLRKNHQKISEEMLVCEPKLLDHPYFEEIEQFTPLESELQIKTPTPAVPFDNCPFYLITNKSELSETIDQLKNEKEIALDLEHHSLRSYMGLTCLIQISTRTSDYIIDAFSLRQELQDLNEIFTDPKILKIFHGADNDILWLQKDFGLYVVNMFDTHQAAKIMGYPYRSLSYLLKRFCDVDAAKRYQRADWRIRPLPTELVDYARTDTHYLLFIKDVLQNELIERSGSQKDNLLLKVYERSKVICQKKYEKPLFQDTDFLKLVKESSRVFNSRQLHALKLLFEWRDRIAREEDESVDFVLPNHMLMKIAEFLPKEKQGIFGCCNPIPSYVKQNLVEIHQYVISAREITIQKPVNDLSCEDQYFEPPPFDPESVLNCVHDHIHSSDITTKEYMDMNSFWSALTERQLLRNEDALESNNLLTSVGSLSKYMPQELLSEMEKDLLKNEYIVQQLKWYLLPLEEKQPIEEEYKNVRKIDVLPTPAEINNADDIVPLKRRKTSKRVLQPPEVPLLPSCLQKVAEERKSIMNEQAKREQLIKQES